MNRLAILALAAASTLPAHAAIIIEPGDFTFSVFTPDEIVLDIGVNMVFGAFQVQNDRDTFIPVTPAGTVVLSHELVAIDVTQPGPLAEIAPCAATPGVVCGPQMVEGTTPLPFDFGPVREFITIQEENCRDCNYQIKIVVGDDPAAVPEPSTMILLGTALSGLAWWRRRRG